MPLTLASSVQGAMAADRLNTEEESTHAHDSFSHPAGLSRGMDGDKWCTKMGLSSPNLYAHGLPFQACVSAEWGLSISPVAVCAFVSELLALMLLCSIPPPHFSYKTLENREGH